MAGQKKIAIVSLIVRRDLESPLRFFDKVQIAHFYRAAVYEDMLKADIGERTIAYSNGGDLYNKLRDYNPDIIQGIEPYSFPAGMGEYITIVRFSLVNGTPYFFPMLENRPPELKFGRCLAPFLKKYLKFYAMKAAFIIPLNKGAEKNLKNLGVAESKLRHILWGTWGVDTDEFSPDGEAGPDIKRDGRKIILFVGRLDESKGLNYLMDAFLKLSVSRENIRLIIIGEGKLKGNIHDFVRAHNLQNQVSILGTVKNREIPSYFRMADVTVTPSVTTRRWEEQVGMVNIQSISCGTPVISTKSGAIPEYMPDEKAALLVREMDSEALFKAMDKLLGDDDLRSRMGIEGRRYALERYDARTNIKLAQQVILDMLSELNAVGK